MYLNLLFLLVFFSISVQAKVIQFPDHELATEYVLPVFVKTNAVLNRSVTLSKRLEVRFSGAFRPDEPFYTTFGVISSASFYINEFHGIGASFIYFFPGLSRRGANLKYNGIKQQKSKVTDFYFHADLAPVPVGGVFFNYQFSPLYGKISFTKTVVFNFSIYSFFGLGGVFMENNNQPYIVTPASHFGMGQKFYINKYISIDLGIDFLIYKGPNFVDSKLTSKNQQFDKSIPEYEDFNQQDLFLRFLTRIGCTFLL